MCSLVCLSEQVVLNSIYSVRLILLVLLLILSFLKLVFTIQRKEYMSVRETSESLLNLDDIFRYVETANATA